MVSKDMYFYDVERCNWFASQLTKRYGNYSYRDLVPMDHRATAYCKPVLVNAEKMGVAVGNSVNVIRTNGQICEGIFSVVGTEADLESQNVKAIIDLDPTCAPSMFLNEAVKIETVSENTNG